ncbi:MAG: phage tail protein [Lachnospiraceae bacterium]|nr:phage tail protein [Lachnospiraceae bacterium]
MVTYAKPKVGGAISVAPVGTTLPTDAQTALDVAFNQLGYISEDGFTNSISRESTDIKAWGGDTVLTVQTDFSNKYSTAFLDTIDLNMLKTIFGSANVSGALNTGIDVKVNSKELDEMSIVVDMVLKDGTLHRIVAAKAKITEIGDIVYKSNDALAYEVTFTTYPDASGDCAHDYFYKA